MNTTPLTAPRPDSLRWSETLRDNSQVLIRPITSQDGQAERAFIEGLSPESRRFRFLGQVKYPSDALIKQLTDIDNDRQMAFVAVIPDGDRERIVGVSRYGMDAGGTSCECAVTVDDAWHDRGLGTLLMRHLIEVARSHGIHRMLSVDAADNARMRELASFLGFQTRIDPDDASQVIHELTLQAPA
jgi:GNAT superfamily N-acetyltransferase